MSLVFMDLGMIFQHIHSIIKINEHEKSLSKKW